jgi:hygromycin-B 7''-O-kinase
VLPRIETREEFKQMDRPALAGAARALAGRLGVRGELSPAGDGSMPVFLADDAVLKLFAAPFRRWYDAEKAFLSAVHGRLGVPTPEILATGEQDGWGYVLMRRLFGTPMDRGAPDERCFDQLGEVVANLAAVPIDGLPAPDDLRTRIAGCAAGQRDKGLSEAWIQQIDDFLAAHAPRTLRLALTHTELGPGHVLVEDGTIRGIIDFADASVGEADMEWPAIGIFLSRGDRGRFGRVVRAARRPIDPARLMACTLLHPYANLAWYLREIPPPTGTSRLEQLADFYFGC